jgi:hypothetical protein
MPQSLLRRKNALPALALNGLNGKDTIGEGNVFGIQPSGAQLTVCSVMKSARSCVTHLVLSRSQYFADFGKPA